MQEHNGRMANIQYELLSGRSLGITGMGNPKATRVIVFCHPAPGSSRFDPDPIASASRDVHILAFDRPGYGASDPLPAGKWPSIAQAADDMAEYLHAAAVTAQDLGGDIPAVGAVGWSAGGRVALALAARHPGLVDRVAVLATPAPDGEVQWIDRGLAASTARLGALAPDDAIEQFTDILLRRIGPLLPPDDPEEPVSLELLGATDVDARALAYLGARDRLSFMLRDAFLQGPRGLAADILSYTVRDWGFDLDRVAAKTLLLYGGADAVAGHAHAAWYHDHLPDSRIEMSPGAGHLLIIPLWDRVLAHLAPGAKLQTEVTSPGVGAGS
jgi:pimeloyl-ACP methyl ester carboxylesterase